MTASLLSIAMGYYNAGMNVLPMKPQTKKPALRTWRHWYRQRQTAEDIYSLFNTHGGNIGAVLGGVSGNAYVVDCEDVGLFNEFATEIAHTGVRTWTAKTKRGGHIYLRSSQPVKPVKREGYEIRSSRQYVLCPPSIHPDGGTYEWATKPDAIAIADALPFTQIEFRPEVAGIPRKLARILANDAETLKRYPSRSEADFAVIRLCINAGFDLARTQALLESSTYPSHYRSLEGKRRADWLFAAFHKLQAQGDSAEFAQVRSNARRAISVVQSQPWKGRTARTDKAVLLAHLGTVERIGKTNYQLSARDGSEITLVKPTTFSASTNRLIGLGWFDLDRDSVGTLAVRYALDFAQIKMHISAPTPISPHVCECSHLVQFGVFERAGLGKAALEIWQCLHGQSLKVVQISKMLGIHRNTVRLALMRMNVYSLVDRDGKRWTAKQDADFASIAAKLGTSQIAITRRKRHLEERNKFRRQFTREG